MNDYAKKNNLIKGEMVLTGEDIREGLTAIISVKLTEPQFEGQTKTKLGNSEVKGIVETMVADGWTTSWRRTRRRPEDHREDRTWRPRREKRPARRGS